MRLSIRQNLLFSLMLAACLIVPALSQEPNTPAARDVNTPAVQATPRPASAGQGFTPTNGSSPVSVRRLPGAAAGQQESQTELDRRMKTLISVTFREAPIEDVLKSFAEQANIDIVKSPAVTGKVTATLTDVPLDEAMNSILDVHGYGYRKTESVVLVVPKDQLVEQIPLARRVYHIDFADLDALSKAIKDMLSAQGKIAVNTDTRHIAIIDTDVQIAMFDKVIEDMDKETPQILVEAKIYDVSCEAYLDFGFDWNAGTMTVFNSETGVPIDSATSNTQPFSRTNFGSSIQQAPKGDFNMRLGVLNDNVNIDATFRAVKDTVKSRLLASPKILVLNGKDATIKIVSEIPYQELTQTSGGGNIGTTKFKEVGVTLLVTPYVVRGDKIKLKVNPEFSVQAGTVAINIPSGLSSISSSQPIVNKRTASTQTLIGDGQTVVIGGLRKKDVLRELSQVPLLGDIPLLGELFKYHGDKTINSELIVFITPRLITKPELTNHDVRSLELMDSELTEPDGPEPTQEGSKPGAADGSAEEGMPVRTGEPATKTEPAGKKETKDLYFPPGNW
jgi:type IV pilus secretin PilQ/predicted competence protein